MVEIDNSQKIKRLKFFCCGKGDYLESQPTNYSHSSANPTVMFQEIQNSY